LTMMMTRNVSHSDQTSVCANGIEIVYDTFGEPDAPPVLLIMGLGCQMIDWHEKFCAQLAARRYRVIRFDNRDIGLSARFDGAGVPDIPALLEALEQGKAVQVPYLLRDMADDAVGLLDALKIESAHVVGLSMGGMIAQMVAIHYPKRVSTLTSIMSSTGDPELPRPTEEAWALLSEPTPTERAEYVESRVQHRRVLCGPEYPIDEAFVREHAGRLFDRGLNPAGFARQLAAILASGSRKEALKSVTVPTLVIHGDADPLVPVEGGIDTAHSIPGAELLIIEGMGHDWPPTLWPQLIEAIAYHAIGASP
jgi:pimeloyl-ACP methyl ester carboxylesterase